MSTEDHPDWSRPMIGPNSLDSILERRSTVSNDNGIEDGTVPPANYTAAVYRGKFFPRGMRGKIERVEIYCIRTAAGQLTLGISPHPCMGPIHLEAVVPGAAWAWQGADIEEMWNYDSLFVWVQTCSPDVSYGYDAVQPFDGHRSTDAGAMWFDQDIRLFIRFIYTGETPGDVPVSGILNTIKIPSISSDFSEGNAIVNLVWTNFITITGPGFIDLIIIGVNAVANSHLTDIRVLCDGEVAFDMSYLDMNNAGLAVNTPPVALTRYGANAICYLVLSKTFEFRRQLILQGMAAAAGVWWTGYVFPTMLR